ncbi:hypothetical protein C5612_18510 [Pseudomonas frederiksbergensis]|uniref:Uncharacterized protein n=1 Tax=Pseudomonas frederiksbergensis TaxID=104087 RepID=A0A2S8HJ88_9PSED|nr:hypothetical protein C5612_18510 [Pseudomonas frederiksbergensis]
MESQYRAVASALCKICGDRQAPMPGAEPVGAGLLAKAVCQTTSILTVPPSSRASPLPQGLCLIDRH